MTLLRKIIYLSFIQKLIIRLLQFYINLVYLTSKKTIINDKEINEAVKNNENLILVFWHGRLMINTAILAKLDTQLYSIVSSHTDGNFVANTIAKFRSKIIRGSTSKGSARVIRESLNILKTPNNSLCISTDGPRGTRMRINSQFVAIAQKTGASIITCNYSCKSAIFANSWDRFLIPTIFNNIKFEYGKKYQIDKSLNKDEIAKKTKEIEDEMNNITWRLDQEYNHPKIEQG